VLGGHDDVGPPGAGHFSKMVHNGIEYGMLAAYGEGFEDMPRRVPDITKVRELIGFRPTLKLEEIVKAVIVDVAD